MGRIMTVRSIAAFVAVLFLLCHPVAQSHQVIEDSLRASLIQIAMPDHWNRKLMLAHVYRPSDVPLSSSEQHCGLSIDHRTTSYSAPESLACADGDGLLVTPGQGAGE